MNSLLLVVDVQNDFIDGSLGSKEAISTLPNIIKKVKNFNGDVVFTRDTHDENYMSSQEGKNLPVVHCVKNTNGWQLADELEAFRKDNNCKVFDKPTFGSVECAEYIKELFDNKKVDEVTLIGYCTDICVVSNALIIKAMMPELKLKVDSKCCAGVTPQKHNSALETMASCQIEIV
ncbi:MAG: isochorismatase family cysteine hydrolase [Bacillota bacterium]|nr:isochorismatase family cysteine hydrolase [Bacillota bacterium]